MSLFLSKLAGSTFICESSAAGMQCAVAAANIAACARAALAGGDAFGYIRDHVNDSVVGWDVVPNHCVGAKLNGATYSHVARAVRLVPGKSLRKRLRREAQAA